MLFMVMINENCDLNEDVLPQQEKGSLFIFIYGSRFLSSADFRHFPVDQRHGIAGQHDGCEPAEFKKKQRTWNFGKVIYLCAKIMITGCRQYNARLCPDMNSMVRLVLILFVMTAAKSETDRKTTESLA